MSVTYPTTFLDLVQRLHLEVGVSGDPPTTVSGQTGELLKLVAYIATAWYEIQTKREDWDWLRKSTSWTTVNGQAFYSPTDCGIPSGRFGQWVTTPGSVRNYTTSVGPRDEIHMGYVVDYDTWRNTYLFGGNRDVRTRPTVYAIRPSDHGLALGPVPNGNYTVTADYYEAPVQLAADTDQPACPVQHRMVIVYRAMMDYGEQENAPEVYHRGALNYHPMMQKLESHQRKPLRFAGALV